MQHMFRFALSVIALGALAAGGLWPVTARAQSIAGQARVVQASVRSLFGVNTTVLSDTGTLSSTNDAREASQGAGSAGALLAGNTLHASTIGWPDQVVSEASIADLAISVAGVRIGADFVMSRAFDTAGGTGGGVDIDGLAINGMPVDVTGSPNQMVWIPGGRLVINEQQTSASGTVVNALHLVVEGVADVVVASATAGIQ